MFNVSYSRKHLDRLYWWQLQTEFFYKKILNLVYPSDIDSYRLIFLTGDFEGVFKKNFADECHWVSIDFDLRDPFYKEQVAREKLQLAQPGDTIYYVAE